MSAADREEVVKVLSSAKGVADMVIRGGAVGDSESTEAIEGIKILIDRAIGILEVFGGEVRT